MLLVYNIVRFLFKIVFLFLKWPLLFRKICKYMHLYIYFFYFILFYDNFSIKLSVATMTNFY